MANLQQKGAYAPGEKIRAVLRFDWEGRFEVVTIEFHRTIFGGPAYGNFIELRSQTHECVVEDGQPRIVANLEGRIPDHVRSGTYVCKYVRCLIPTRGWTILFEDVRDVSLRVRRELPAGMLGAEGAQLLAVELGT